MNFFRSHAWRILSVLCLTGLGWLSAQSTTHGQAPTWSRPIRLSSQDSSSWFPDVAADASGRAHIVWSSGVSGYDTVNYVTSLDGQAWSAINDIVAFRQTSGSEATRPTLFADERGILHLTCRYTSIYYSQAFADTALTAVAWQAPEIMSADQVAYFSRLLIDGEGILHLVYTENVYSPDCPICYHLYHRSSNDEGFSWSEPVDITADAITGAAKPQLVADKQNNLHVVWEEGKGGAYGQLADPTTVRYAVSYDQGKTWSAPLKFPSVGASARNVTLGLDGEDKLVVVWWNIPDDTLSYQLSRDRGRTWSAPQTLPGVWGIWSVYQSRLDAYAMATDSAGQAHLIMVGRTAKNQTSLSVLHMLWNGSRWLGPTTLTTLRGDAPEWPRIAIGRGNQLHAVWFVRDAAHIFESDKGQYEIWYAHGESSAPALPAVVWPTATPTTAAPVVVATARPTPLAAPTFNTPYSTVTFSSLTSETERLLLLAQNSVPSLILIAVVMLAVWIQQRRRTR